MLAAIRSITKSLFFKLFLGLLVLSFAVWGIGDIFTGGAPNRVAQVGELEVDAAELDSDFRRALQDLQQQTRQPITRADAIRLGLLEQSLQRLVARRILDAEAAALGVTTSDEAVARLITEEPAFQVDGRFDRDRFQALLRQNGFDESVFAEDLRAERSRDALAGAIRPVSSLPGALGNPLATRLAETRSGELLVMASSHFTDVEPSSDDELQAYLEANEARFQARERRDITAVLLDAALLVDELVIDDALLRERYEARRDAYSTPERRVVRQLRGSDEADLRQAFEALRTGEDIEAVAARIDGVALSALGEVEEASLPQAFAQPIFAVAGAGAITPPTESAFGWHVFRIDAIVPASVQPFAEVRDDLRLQAAREQAAEQLPDLAIALDDALGAGDPLEDAAAALDVPLVTVRGLDRSGLTADGEVFAPFADWGTLLVEAFDAGDGETSLLEETADGRYFVFRVDGIAEARPLTLDEARDRVLLAWRADTALDHAEAAAATALAAIDGGMSTDEAVTAHGLERRPVPVQTRTDAFGAPVVNDALFATTPGDVADEVVIVEDGAALVVVDAATGLDEEVAAATRLEIDQGFGRDLLVQFEMALRREHAVQVDRATLQRLFPAESDG